MLNIEVKQFLKDAKNFTAVRHINCLQHRKVEASTCHSARYSERKRN